jgi:uncharacterized protein
MAESIRKPNNLIFESSPYLLQHAHNPVQWQAWNDASLQQAQREDKPILISIGYSACHWCHVMERESFEDEKVAAFMNEHFVCIKVDREERPDLDHIYMEAVQILTGQGGWPLNMFLTPNGKPFYGGTYFPTMPAHGRPSWGQVLHGVVNSFKTNRAAINEQAQKLTEHIGKSATAYLTQDAVAVQQHEQPDFQTAIEKHVINCQKYFDTQYGGFGSAPKFPHFHNLLFLLQYSFYTKNEIASAHVFFTLDKMLQGGIYDQIGGGLARYSTDAYWLAPHFEKMLYDNALLIELLAETYAVTKNENYFDALLQTFGFIEREMLSPEGGFYAALDADSEGEEGKFYVWTKNEIENILKDEAEWFCEYFDVSENGNWEHTNILNRKISAADFAKKRNMDVGLLKQKLKSCSDELLTERNKRIRPGLDDKIILGWNAMMTIALAKAFQSTQHMPFKTAAGRNMDFLIEKFISEQNENIKLFHTYKNNQAAQPAFLDDAALLVQALIEIYQITFQKKYLLTAKKVTGYIINEFYDESSGTFYYTSSQQKDIILRKTELPDSVTPSGNSVMAHNLAKLAVVFDDNNYRTISDNMLLKIKTSAEKYPLSFGNWAILLLQQIFPLKEIAIVGNDFSQFSVEIMQHYIPAKILMASVKSDNDFALLANKPEDDDTRIYLCENNICYAAVKSVDEFLKL